MGNLSEYISIGAAIRSKKYLYPLAARTVRLMCENRELIAMKLGNNSKGRGHWQILTSSIIEHRIKNHNIH